MGEAAGAIGYFSGQCYTMHAISDSSNQPANRAARFHEDCWFHPWHHQRHTLSNAAAHDKKVSGKKPSKGT
jgi:hypothetical protein